jgi:hypothetical protein
VPGRVPDPDLSEEQRVRRIERHGRISAARSAGGWRLAVRARWM